MQIGLAHLLTLLRNPLLCSEFEFEMLDELAQAKDELNRILDARRTVRTIKLENDQFSAQ